MLLSSCTCVVAVPSSVMSELAGEAIILDPVSGNYYGLSNDVGVSIWKLLQTPTQISNISDSIVLEYDVSPEECERDIVEVVEFLLAHKLVETCDDCFA